jgi:choline dehydrogenase
MITVCPHNRDWDRLAELTGDTSWNSRRMQRYFHRLERCSYITKPWPAPDWLRHVPHISERLVNRSGHGFKGWLGTDVASPALALGDGQLLKIILSAAESSLGDFLKRRLAPIARTERLLRSERLACPETQFPGRLVRAAGDDRRTAEREP